MNDNETPDEDNVVDFAGMRERLMSGEDTSPKQIVVDPTENVKPGKFEIHIHPQGEGFDEVVEVAEGWIKFGAQFIAVTDLHDDASNVLFAIPTHLVRYIKRLGDDGEVKATLSL